MTNAQREQLRSKAAIVKLAEEMARESHDALTRQMAATVRIGWVSYWHRTSEAERERWVAAQFDLLTDLTRPTSRDAVARLVGEAVGWDAFDVSKAIEVSSAMLAGLYRLAGLPDLPRWEPAPPPEESLTLIALAVLK